MYLMLVVVEVWDVMFLMVVVELVVVELELVDLQVVEMQEPLILVVAVDLADQVVLEDLEW